MAYFSYLNQVNNTAFGIQLNLPLKKTSINPNSKKFSLKNRGAPYCIKHKKILRTWDLAHLQVRLAAGTHHLTLLPKPTKLSSYSSHAANTGDARYNKNTINNICTANTNTNGENMDLEEGGRREEGKDR